MKGNALSDNHDDDPRFQKVMSERVRANAKYKIMGCPYRVFRS